MCEGHHDAPETWRLLGAVVRKARLWKMDPGKSRAGRDATARQSREEKPNEGIVRQGRTSDRAQGAQKGRANESARQVKETKPNLSGPKTTATGLRSSVLLLEQRARGAEMFRNGAAGLERGAIIGRPRVPQSGPGPLGRIGTCKRDARAKR